MATPREFDRSNMTWKGPAPGIGDLPAFREGDETISCWQLTPEERDEIAEEGVVWLRVWGRHPPVAVEGISPWADARGGP